MPVWGGEKIHRPDLKDFPRILPPFKRVTSVVRVRAIWVLNRLLEKPKK